VPFGNGAAAGRKCRLVTVGALPKVPFGNGAAAGRKCRLVTGPPLAESAVW
jgi:hypothetical protein